MVRALRVTIEELDNELVRLQSKGDGINQIIPCPDSINFKDGMLEGKEFNGGMKMGFVIIYSEKP